MKVAAARVLDRIIALLAVGSLAASKQDWPTGFWPAINQAAPWGTLVLLLVASVFSFSPLTAMAKRRLAPAREKERRRILTAYGSMLKMALDAGMEISDPALHVWKVGKRRARRVVTYRLSEGVHLRRFSPKIGVGVVGLCWRRGEESGVDVEALSKQLDSEAAFKAYAAGEPDGVMNLSWDEFQSVRHRGAVFASPIIRHERVVGVVSFDTSWGFVRLKEYGILKELNSLAATLADSMEALS